MKRLLSFSFLLTAAATGVDAQTFEWNAAPRPSAHPKEVQLDDRSSAEQQDGLAGVYDAAADGSPTAYGETYSAEEMTGSHAELPLGTLLRVTNTENGRSVVVRVTDKGRECADCLITLSEAAARKLGIGERSSVSLERTGFSNWNPVPPSVTPAAEAPAAANRETAVASAPKPSVISREVVVPRPTPADAPAGVKPPAPTVPAGERQARGVEAPAPATYDEVVAAPANAERYAIQLAAYTNETYALRRVNELKEQGLEDVYYRSVKKDDGQTINRVYSGTFETAGSAQEAAEKIRSSYNIAGIVAKM